MMNKVMTVQVKENHQRYIKVGFILKAQVHAGVKRPDRWRSAFDELKIISLLEKTPFITLQVKNSLDNPFKNQEVTSWAEPQEDSAEEDQPQKQNTAHKE